MNRVQLFRKVDERTFLAHHMLLHAAELDITVAESTERGHHMRSNMAVAPDVLTAPIRVSMVRRSLPR